MAQEKSNTHEQEDGQVDLEFDGYEETTVDLPSEGKDETSGVEIEPEAQAKSDDSDDEHSEVSKNVQKRIDRLPNRSLWKVSYRP